MGCDDLAHDYALLCNLPVYLQGVFYGTYFLGHVIGDVLDPFMNYYDDFGCKYVYILFSPFVADYSLHKVLG